MIYKFGGYSEVLGFSKRVWQCPPVRAIQTGLDIEDDSAGLVELAQGACPNAWPFVIVEELGACHEDSMYDIQPISKGKKSLQGFEEIVNTQAVVAGALLFGAAFSVVLWAGFPPLGYEAVNQEQQAGYSMMDSPALAPR